jgi:hypothetical protein
LALRVGVPRASAFCLGGRAELGHFRQTPASTAPWRSGSVPLVRAELSSSKALLLFPREAPPCPQRLGAPSQAPLAPSAGGRAPLLTPQWRRSHSGAASVGDTGDNPCQNLGEVSP